MTSPDKKSQQKMFEELVEYFTEEEWEKLSDYERRVQLNSFTRHSQLQDLGN